MTPASSSSKLKILAETRRLPSAQDLEAGRAGQVEMQRGYRDDSLIDGSVAIGVGDVLVMLLGSPNPVVFAAPGIDLLGYRRVVTSSTQAGDGKAIGRGVRRHIDIEKQGLRRSRI